MSLDPTNADLLRAIKDNNSTIESLKGEVNELRSTIVSMREEINRLRSDLGERVNAVEVKQAQNSAQILENKNEIERIHNMNCVVISGVPVTLNEDVSTIFNHICSRLGYSDRFPTVFVSRHKPKQNPTSLDSKKNRTNAPPIFVEFGVHAAKREFMYRYYKSADLNMTCLGMSNESRIYINERLTKTDMAIKKEAVQLKKDGKLHSVYVNWNGRVSVRLTGTSEPKQIDDVTYLRALLS
jgi:hypothetical protein